MTVRPQRDPAHFRRVVLRNRQAAEFQRQKAEAIAREKQARVDAMSRASAGDSAAPMWAQIRQCYIEHRPEQLKNERKMRRCVGGAVFPVHPGRRCLTVGTEETLALHA